MTSHKRAVIGIVLVLLVGGAFVYRGTHTPLSVGISETEQLINAQKDPIPLSVATPATDAEKKDTGSQSSSTDAVPAKKLALLADGCFWCVEHDLEKVAGVLSVVSGYAGGKGENPTYENYVAMGYKEVVLVTYDPSIVSFENLVEHIIKHGDPTDAAGSFNDRGLQYAPAIYYENAAEKNAAQRVIDAVDALKVFDKPLALRILPITRF